jgi:hypothetical protein
MDHDLDYALEMILRQDISMTLGDFKWTNDSRGGWNHDFFFFFLVSSQNGEFLVGKGNS